ncbi:metallophosphoesterase family protein [Massilia sp. W12]|uniref:metallophosphoesterase family protein n=1 Tax=Massilia sp. W12 TaxID=3126507 RepID=UPI0030D0DEC5
MNQAFPRRIFAVSDIHTDYDENRRWLLNLSRWDYTDDVLLLGGDVSDLPHLMEEALRELARRFHQVLFVPGNHDLWLVRSKEEGDSLQKWARLRLLAEECGVSTRPWRMAGLQIVPLLSWYDWSFGQPSERLMQAWADFVACRWPHELTQPAALTQYFHAQNLPHLHSEAPSVISFSHFMPRLDLFPAAVPPQRRFILPVLGSSALDAQIRQLGSRLHVYGHSHLNRCELRDGVRYINNAYAYPNEAQIAAKRLLCLDPWLDGNGPD